MCVVCMCIAGVCFVSFCLVPPHITQTLSLEGVQGLFVGYYNAVISHWSVIDGLLTGKGNTDGNCVFVESGNVYFIQFLISLEEKQRSFCNNWEIIKLMGFQ